MQLCHATALVALAALTAGCQPGTGREIKYRDVHIAEAEDHIGFLKNSVAEKDAALAAALASKNQAAPAPEVAPKTGTEDLGNGVEAIDTAEGYVMTVSSDLLFAPGSADLSSKAAKSLKTVADKIKQDFPNNQIRVAGHSDSNPIKRTADKWRDNFDLSGERAYQVLAQLEKLGVTDKQLHFAGYGEHVPRVAGNLAKNRRVEVIVLKRTVK
jgi:flagellar motor protein MotB